MGIFTSDNFKKLHHPWSIFKSVGPKLVPYFKTVALFFVIYPSNSVTNFVYMLFKCAPIAALCLFIILNGMTLGFEYSYSRRILIGLIFSMIGDALLVYKPYDEMYFIMGMLAFAISHILYFTAFGMKPLKFRIALLLLTMLTVPVSIGYTSFINGYLLKILVPIYVCLVSMMVWRAISRIQMSNQTLKWTELCCTFGAILFAISDLILAYDAFVAKLTYSHQLIMVTYYLAQLGIALSIVNSNVNHEVNHRVIQHHDVVNAFYKVHSHFTLSTVNTVTQHID